MFDRFRNSFNQPNVPQSKNEQSNNMFLSAMSINTPASRKRPSNPTPNRANQFYFDQSQVAPPQFSPFANSLENMQQSNHIFPNAFENSPVLHENNPFSLGAHCQTPSQQLPMFNGPTVQTDKLKIDNLKREIKRLENLKCPELELTRSLLFEELNKLENNVNPDWLDFNQWKEITLLEYVVVPLRDDVNIPACLFGVNGNTLKQIRMKYCCEIDLCGAGSSSNRLQEVQLLATRNPLYQHFAWPLHLRICIKAPAFLAYKRLSNVLNLVYRILHTNEPFNWDGIQISGYFPNQNKFTMNQSNQKHQ